MFVYQAPLDKGKGIDYVLSWKSDGVCTSKLKPLYSAFLHSIKLSGYKVTGLRNKYYLQIYLDNCDYKPVDKRVIDYLDDITFETDEDWVL